MPRPVNLILPLEHQKGGIATMSGARITVRIACAIPFRKIGDQIEFCLVAPPGSSNWEYPCAVVTDGELPSDLASRQAELAAGLRGRVLGDDPLDEVASTRGSQRVSIVAFLFEVTHEAPGVDPLSLRRRWCFAEEARVRLRRKPLRRMIDAAVARMRADGAVSA